jgi:hypothetical protein
MPPIAAAEGFSYEQRSGGTVVVLHDGRTAATLRGDHAQEFLNEVESGDG